MATMSREEIAEFIRERWNEGWRETLLQVVSIKNEERNSEAEIFRIADIENPRLKDLELRKLIMREHGNEFHERDFLQIIAESTIDAAISAERIATALETLKGN